MSVTKAVIPAAGLGTRFLPATKATPKEMLPVVDKPAIQYVVEEAVAAGLTDVLDDHRPQQAALEDHFDRNYELEAALEAKGDAAPARPGPGVQRPGDHALRPPGRPPGPRPRRARAPSRTSATSRSPSCSATTSSTPATRCSPGWSTSSEEHGGSVIALMEVPAGADPPLRLRRRRAHRRATDVVRVTGLVEKPDAADAPSNSRSSAATSSTPRSSRCSQHDRARPRRRDPAHRRPAGAGGRRRAGGGVHGVVFRGRRYDTGDRARLPPGHRRARPCEREDLGPDFRDLARRVRHRGDGCRQLSPR